MLRKHVSEVDGIAVNDIVVRSKGQERSVSPRASTCSANAPVVVRMRSCMRSSPSASSTSPSSLGHLQNAIDLQFHACGFVGNHLAIAQNPGFAPDNIRTINGFRRQGHGRKRVLNSCVMVLTKSTM